MCNPPKIPSMNDISDQLARVNQQARQIIANPLAALSVLVLGPVLGLIGGALVDDNMRNAAADAAAQDNQAELDAMNQQQAEDDQALADAQAAADEAQATADQAAKDADDAAKQAAADALAAQQVAQAPASGEVPWTSAAQQAAALAPSGGQMFPSGGGGGGGGGGFGPVPTSEAIEAAQPPPFEMEPPPFEMGPTPAFDLRTQYMQSQALDQEFVDQSQPIETPQEFFPEDETAQLTISDQQSESFEGFGRVINYPEAEDIGFSKIPSAMYTPLIEYDESHAPKYMESGPLLPIHNRMKADLERPSSGSMTPSGGLTPSYNNPMYAIQDIPDDLPNRLIDYSSRGHQTSMPIRRSELPLSMPIRTNFGNANTPSPFEPMLQDLRSLQDHLKQLIKNAESYSKYNARFSGMVDMKSVMAPIRRNLDELEEANKYIKRARKENQPRSAEEHEQSRYAKKLVDDLMDDVRTLRNTIEQAGG